MATAAICEQPKLMSMEDLLNKAELPSMPGAALKIMQLAADKRSNLEQVAKVVSTDVALTAKVLKLANSVLYNRGVEFRDALRGVSHIGLLNIRSLALATHVFSLKDNKASNTFDYDFFWRYTLTCGTAARIIAGQTKQANPDEALTAALLQDVGVLVLRRAVPLQHDLAIAMRAQQGLRLWEAEKKVLGFSHVEVGAALAKKWQLPESIVSAIANSHSPGECQLARICECSDFIHNAIYERRGPHARDFRTPLQAIGVDPMMVLMCTQRELPAIAEACSCPSWNAAAEQDLKARIAELLPTQAPQNA